MTLATLSSEPPAHGTNERRLLWALSGAAFMVNLDSRVVAPLLPGIAAELGVSLARSAWLVSAYLLPYGLCQMLFGPLADRYGKVTVCSHAMAAFSIGTACTALWPSFGAIVTLRAFTGAMAAGLIPLTLAYIGDTVPYEQRQATIGRLMAAAGAAQAFSTGLGGSIAALFSWHAVFPCLGGLALIGTFALYTLGRYERRRPRPAGARHSYRAVLAAPGMRRLLALVATEGFLFMGGFTYLSGLLEQRFALDSLGIGIVLSLTGVAQLGVAALLPVILRRVSQRRLLAVGGGALGSAYLLSAVAPHAALVALGCALLGAGFVLCHTTLQTRATEAFPSGRGTALALFAFSLFLGSGVGTALLGLALDGVGFGVLFALIGAALFAFTSVAVRTLGLSRVEANPPRRG